MNTNVDRNEGDSPNDRQIGGAHYATEYQHWDFVRDVGLGYMEGQITKYLYRHERKNKAQDVQKAMHFLDKLIEQSIRGRTAQSGDQEESHAYVEDFIKASALEPIGWEASAIRIVSTYTRWNELKVAKLFVQAILDHYAAVADDTRSKL